MSALGQRFQADVGRLLAGQRPFAADRHGLIRLQSVPPFPGRHRPQSRDSARYSPVWYAPEAAVRLGDSWFVDKSASLLSV